MSKFTTVISPATAIDRIMQTGNNPMQFISRAYRDHSLEWAHQFEALARINEWNFTCDHNYEKSTLVNFPNCGDTYHSCIVWPYWMA